MNECELRQGSRRERECERENRMLMEKNQQHKTRGSVEKTQQLSIEGNVKAAPGEREGELERGVTIITKSHISV